MTSQNILYIEASKADYKEQLEEKKAAQLAEISLCLCQYPRRGI